jgi:glutathione peroxidase
MRLARVQLFVILTSLLLASVMHAKPKTTPRPTVSVTDPFSFKVTDIDGKPRDLAQYRGKAVLIVNTASRCGFTPQYEGLEALYDRYRARGFEVLAFPANDFMGQEPGTNDEIKTFCATRFKTSFPLFAKVSVKGKEMAPLYQWLTTSSPFPGDIPWNFTKFLVAPDGRVVARFGPRTKPEDAEVIAALEPILPLPAAKD